MNAYTCLMINSRIHTVHTYLTVVILGEYELELWTRDVFPAPAAPVGSKDGNDNCEFKNK